MKNVTKDLEQHVEDCTQILIAFILVTQKREKHKELIPVFYSFTHTVIFGKPVVYSHLNEVILQSSVV